MYKADPSTEDSWKQALSYFRERKAVIFLSYCRFWERHGFVQQALAQQLARNGVEVLWLDGSGWRSYEAVVWNPSAHLTVCQLPALPFRRFPLVSHWDRRLKTRYIKRCIKRLGGNPVVWVQAGIDESVAQDLPYIDVFSVFDDPYRHAPEGALCAKSRTIVCQNKTAFHKLASVYPSKTRLLLPPVDMSDETMEGSAQTFLPEGFPKRVMGYVGSFFSDGFDLDLFENFIQSFPDWGFVLMGRTDVEGARRLAQWKSYRNFQYFPWVPRNQVASVWKLIDLTLLFYKENPTQDGAFPVKIVESLRFGVPCIATDVPKTGDLEGVFPRTNSPDELKKSVDTALAMTPAEVETLYLRFAREMDPKLHLGRVAAWSRK